MRENVKWIFLLLLFSLPLLWLNVRDSQYWTDDFASYLHQAQNICEGKSQSETGYLFNPRYIFMGPPAYTIGFPLLIAPVYAVFGHDIRVYLILMTLLLIIFLFAMYIFLSSRIKPLYAFLLCLIIAYNPATLFMKGEIMCDICVALFLLLNIIFYERWRVKPQMRYPILLALLNGLLLSLKVTGFVMSVALLFNLLKLLFQKRVTGKNKLVFRNTVIMFFGGPGIYFLLNEVLFPIPHGGISFYMSITKSGSYGDTILQNLDNYITQFQNFFTPEMEKWNALPNISAAVMLSLTVIGFILKIKKQFALTDSVFILYTIVLLIYPYQAGIRFVFPLLPFACYYIYLSAQQLALAFKHKQLIAICAAIILLLQYRTSIENMIESCDQVVDGPQRHDAQVAFEFIRNHTAPNSIFDFRRPRALTLYSNRKSCCNFPWGNPEDVLANIDSLQVNYCLTNSRDVNPGMDSLINLKPELFKKIWYNNQFTVYKFR